MQKVLIVTVPNDNHGRAVEWAANRMSGQPTDYFIAPYLPSVDMLSLSIFSDLSLESRFCLEGNSVGSISVDNKTSVWRRRVGSAIPHPDLDSRDSVACTFETNTARDSSIELASELGAFVANRDSAAKSSRLKPIQLHAAKQVGFSVPDTLISNNPVSIRQFSAAHQHQIIVKSFTSPTWHGKGVCYAPFTRRVTNDLLDLDETLKACPAIYQKLCSKAYELRVLVAGRSVLTCKLSSQLSEATALDWRVIPASQQFLEPYKLPLQVMEKCIAVAKKLGLVTASIDLAVTEQGEYIFFEANEMGQFLWMEEGCPEIPILQMFTEFLLSGSDNFVFSSVLNPSISYSKYVASGHFERSMSRERNYSSYDDQHVLGVYPE